MPERELISIDENTDKLDNARPKPLAVAGQVANRIAGDAVFQRYLMEKAANTVKRHRRDLDLFGDYLQDAGIPLDDSDFQTNPGAWTGVTWGIIEGFLQWQLDRGYAISTVNARLSTVRTYAQLAVKAGTISRAEGMLIQSVKGFSRQGAVNIDARRDQTRRRTASYTYERDEGDETVEVTRRSTKKARPTLLTEAQALALKRPQNSSEQAWRDALLMCLLLDHGLRASEIALLQASAIDLTAGTMTFYRPKVQGTDHEWTTHALTPTTHETAKIYLGRCYPSDLLPDGPLILATTRLLKNGDGGYLLGDGLNRVRVSERVAYLGRQLGLEKKLSAHDCRHFCATHMARLNYGVDELMAWFGWNSAQTAMRYVAAEDVKQRHRG